MPTRINKFLSSAGVCSRRMADRIIEEGSVTINDRVAVLGDTVTDNDIVRVDGEPILPPEDFLYYAYNKPRGIEVTMNRDVNKNIADELGLKQHIFPIGRLDKDSSGLILLTTDGDIVNKILKPASGHEKEYIAHLIKPVTNALLDGLSAGVTIDGRMTRPAMATRQNKYAVRIVLTEGRNRQVRKMVEKLGNEVRQLKRVRIMNIKLGKLKIGHVRPLSRKEILELKRSVK